jgi:hypothetical protein
MPSAEIARSAPSGRGKWPLSEKGELAKLCRALKSGAQPGGAGRRDAMA